MALILDGRAVRDRLKARLAEKIAAFSSCPKLAIIQIGDNPESDIYINQKISFGHNVGCEISYVRFEKTRKESDVIAKIAELNSDASVSGIIVQIPLPAGFSADRIIESIDPRKDVDGMHSRNIKALAQNLPGIVPATTRGILTLLDEYKIGIAGKKVVVIGRSSLVGRPTALALLNRDATVTVCHSKTENLSQETKSAVILIVAAGKAGLIGAEHVSPGQVVIDVGINVSSGEKLEEEIPKRKLLGDVRFGEVSEIVAAISPVPGGVGPMTVLSLFENLADTHERFAKGKEY